jgi:tetratricopeptide (TPR) repeat protein
MVVIDPCPTCGTPRPADSPAGICPLCLMRLGLDDDEPLSGEGPEAALSLNNNGAPAASGVVERVCTDFTTIEIGDITAYAENLSSLDGAELPEPGRRLFIRGEIARGGMGIVLLGHDTELGRDIAVKVLQDKHRDHPAMVDRFVAEARIAGQLQHPGVVPVHELGMLADHRPFFTMKLVRGSTLAEMLACRSLPSNDRAGFLRIFLRVAETIGYAHERSVIHRDLKPSNIMVGRHGEVMMMDWGLAKVSTRPVNSGAAARDRPDGARRPDSGVRMRERLVMGTPGYMAPEQFEVEMLRDAADLESRPPPSLWLLGRLLIWDDQTERAVDAMARARSAHPDDCWINLDLSLFLSLRPYRPQQAMTFVTTAVALRPASATARLRRGELLEILGEHDDAETELREAVRLAPDHGYAHFTLGHLHAARGHWDQAVPEYQDAIRLMPRHAGKNVAAVCDPTALAALPADELKAWRDFWHEVETRILVDPGYRGRGAPAQATSNLYDKQLGLFPD